MLEKRNDGNEGIIIGGFDDRDIEYIRDEFDISARIDAFGSPSSKDSEASSSTSSKKSQEVCSEELYFEQVDSLQSFTQFESE